MTGSGAASSVPARVVGVAAHLVVAGALAPSAAVRLRHPTASVLAAAASGTMMRGAASIR